MYRTLMIAALFLISAACLQAQQASSSDQTAGKTSGVTTIEGCLQSSGGSYTLTEADGTKVTLSSHANQMIKHVGHQVQITGKPAVKTIGTTEQGGPSTAHQVPVFRVQSIKHVADTCTAK
jgi:hypothetical protein